MRQDKRDVCVRESLSEFLTTFIHPSCMLTIDTQVDPGFRAPVVVLEWDQNFVSRDGQFLQPVGGYSVAVQTCYMNQKATETSSSEEYESNLEMQCSVSGAGGFGPVSGSFSASAGYSSFENSVASKSAKQFTITSFCLSYKLGFDYFGTASLKPTAALAEAIAVARNPDECGTDNKECGKMASEGKCILEAMQKKCKNACHVGTCRVGTCGADSRACGWFNLFDVFGTHFLSTGMLQVCCLTVVRKLLQYDYMILAS